MTHCDETILMNIRTNFDTLTPGEIVISIWYYFSCIIRKLRQQSV